MLQNMVSRFISVCLSVSLSACLYLCPSVSLSVCLAFLIPKDGKLILGIFRPNAENFQFNSQTPHYLPLLGTYGTQPPQQQQQQQQQPEFEFEIVIHESITNRSIVPLRPSKIKYF
ncbi:hypothetical protein F5X97DRAFT_286075 [Nemania serpens]|nr:hypothetical protein F5X97DRAFT_286075 [Nemania serpens]